MNKSVSHRYVATAISLGLLGVPLFSQAATSTATFNVSATVSSACTVNALPLSFGAFNPSLGTALQASTTLNVFCTNTTPFTVGLNTGVNSGSYATGRIMRSTGGDLLTYNLYTSAPLTTVWGDGSGASATQPGTGVGSTTAVPYTVYGSIPVQPQAVPSTSYADTVTVTVTY